MWRDAEWFPYAILVQESLLALLDKGLSLEGKGEGGAGGNN
jgi:hypothetical protein